MASATYRAPTKIRLRTSSAPRSNRGGAGLEFIGRVIMNAPHPTWPVATTPAANFIANRWVASATGATLPMIDPSEGEAFAAIARSYAADVDVAVRAARAAFERAWGALAPADKGRLLNALSRAIVDRAEELTLIEARDCGKPVKQARVDVAACARYFEFYGGAADKL